MMQACFLSVKQTYRCFLLGLRREMGSRYLKPLWFSNGSCRSLSYNTQGNYAEHSQDCPSRLGRKGRPRTFSSFSCHSVTPIERCLAVNIKQYGSYYVVLVVLRECVTYFFSCLAVLFVGFCLYIFADKLLARGITIDYVIVVC